MMRGEQDPDAYTGLTLTQAAALLNNDPFATDAPEHPDDVLAAIDSPSEWTRHYPARIREREES